MSEEQETNDVVSDAESEAQPLTTDPEADGSEQVEAEQAEPELTELEQLQQANAELEDRLVRTQAELVNYRRRANNEIEQFRKYEGLRLVRDLLPVIDNLNRATQAADDADDVQQLKTGVEMVAFQLRETLGQYDVKRIEATGAAFDPNLHEAVQQQPSDDVPAMHVLQELEPGYQMKDRIVRPAKVLVSTGPAESE